MILCSFYKSKEKYKILWFKENSVVVLIVDKDRIGYRIYDINNKVKFYFILFWIL